MREESEGKGRKRGDERERAGREKGMERKRMRRSMNGREEEK